MEKSRNRRYTVNSGNEPQRVPPQESKQVHRERQFPNLSPDSVSCGGGVADKNSFTFKFGWRSSKQLFGTPIKKLVAEEMWHETGSKRRSPGVIARLMGLDGLPFQQPANKQKKDSSENHRQKRTQIEKAQSRGTSFDGRSSRRSSKDQQEFKDVFEVSETPKVESNRYSSHLYAEDLKNNESEMSFIEQKFMEAKRLAAHQDLQSSKDFRDTLEVLDSNKDLLLKYFKRPDSLFKKHLNDLQAAPLQSHFGHVEAMELSDIEKFEHDLSRRSDRENTWLNYDRYHQKHHDAYPRQFDRRHGMHSSPKSSKVQCKGKQSKAEQDAGPTKIVVLKPNLGKVQNAARVVSSPHSPCTFPSEHGTNTEFPDARFRNAKLYHHKNHLPDTARHLRHNSLEATQARELSKEITRQVKNSLNNGSLMFSSSRFRGYAGDDSSCSVSGNESPAESGGRPATVGSSIDPNNCSRRSSHSSESSVSREAKKRLSERWKIAHKSQEGEIISKSSTLAEMLAVSDKEVKSANFDSMSTDEGLHNNFAGNGEPDRSVEPLGISSRDGWKDGCIGSFPRSRSLPASSIVFGSPRAILRNEEVHDDRSMMPKEAPKRERRRARGLDHRHGVNTRSAKSGHKKSWSLHSSQPEDDDFLPDLSTIQNNVKVNLEEDSPILEVLATESFAESPRDASEFSDTVVSVANENAERSSEPSPDKVLPELSSCDLIKGNSSAAEKDNSMKQQLTGVQSPSCKDADQPSPVSVLEPSFTDDLSSCSECFESLSADLQGLRMQLQLLKLESEGYADGPMLISSYEDGVEASTGVSKDNRLCRTEDNWESSYIIDLLSESGIDGTQPDKIIEAWHSLDRPVDLSVFDKLENKYCDWTSCSRSERKLLFDRINSGILKIHEQSVNTMLCVDPSTTNVGSKLMENGLQDALCNMLGSQGKVKDDDALGKVLVGESKWLELRDETDVIGREIEGLLLDDLVAEIAHSSYLKFP